MGQSYVPSSCMCLIPCSRVRESRVVYNSHNFCYSEAKASVPGTSNMQGV